jgi:hypothetical protein
VAQATPLDYEDVLVAVSVPALGTEVRFEVAFYECTAQRWMRAARGTYEVLDHVVLDPEIASAGNARVPATVVGWAELPRVTAAELFN